MVTYGAFPHSPRSLRSCLQCTGWSLRLPRETHFASIRDGRDGSSGRHCCSELPPAHGTTCTPREACCDRPVPALPRFHGSGALARLGEPLPHQLTCRATTNLSRPDLYRIASTQGVGSLHCCQCFNPTRTIRLRVATASVVDSIAGANMDGT